MPRCYYVVWKGRLPGVYETWQGCEQQVKGYSGASFKRFEGRDIAAEEYRLGDPLGRVVRKALSLTPPRKAKAKRQPSATPPPRSLPKAQRRKRSASQTETREVKVEKSPSAAKPNKEKSPPHPIYKSASMGSSGSGGGNNCSITPHPNVKEESAGQQESAQYVVKISVHKKIFGK